MSGPIYFNLRRIFEIEDAKKKEENIDSFFKEFSTLNPNMYKLGNRFALDWFVKTENLYIKFKKSRKLEDWENFWEEFSSLKAMMENEYWKNFDSLYGEYRWFQETLTSNIFIRIWHEIIHILYQAAQCTVLLSMIFVLYSLWDHFLIGMLPNDSVLFALLILLLSVMFYGLLMIIGADIAGLRNQRKSFIRRVIEKFKPEIINYYDEKFLRSRKKVDIPEMYINKEKQSED